MINLVKNLSIFNRRTKSSVIRELLSLTNKPGIISFAGGLPDPKEFPVEVLEDIFQTIVRKQSNTAFQYGPTDGLPELKQEIIKFLKDYEGIDAKPENLLVITASQQGLDLVGRTFIDASDPILVELPSYIGGLQVFKSYGAEMIGVKCDDDGILTGDLEAKLMRLKKEEEHYKFLYTVPDFQNPSGVTMTEERRREIVRLSAEYEIAVIEDSPYRQIRFEGTAPQMMYKMDPNNNVISLFTFSKTFMPGLRLGFLLANDQIIKKFGVLKQSLDLCTSPLNQLFAAEFLKRGLLPNHLKRVNTRYKSKKDAMLEALKRHMPAEQGVSWTKPEGGLFLWLRLPEYINTTEMFTEAVDEKVAYVIGSAFFCDGGGTNTMRLNFSYPSEAEIEEGVKRLAAVIKKKMVRR